MELWHDETKGHNYYFSVQVSMYILKMKNHFMLVGMFYLRAL